MPDKIITLRLSSNTVGQIIDALNERMLIWQATAEYLESGHTDLADCIEECTHPDEAQALADCYHQIIEELTTQRDAQIDE